jgi:hypothetical protein
MESIFSKNHAVFQQNFTVTNPDENCFQFNKMKTQSVFMREMKCSSTAGDQYDTFL